MELYVEVQGAFTGGPWNGEVRPVRFEKSKPRIAVVVIDEPIEGEPQDITAAPPFTRHVYSLAERHQDDLGSLTIADTVGFTYDGPMTPSSGRLDRTG